MIFKEHSNKNKSMFRKIIFDNFHTHQEVLFIRLAHIWVEIDLNHVHLKQSTQESHRNLSLNKCCCALNLIQ